MSRFTRWSRVSPLALCLARERLAWRCAWGLFFPFLALGAVSLFWRTAARPGFGADSGVRFSGWWAQAAEAPQQARKACSTPAQVAELPPVELGMPSLPVMVLAEPLVAEVPETVEVAPEMEGLSVTNPLALELPAQLVPAPPVPGRPAAAATAPRQEGDIVPASYRETPLPPYPPALRSRRLSGNVSLRIEVDAAGVPQRVEVCQPSAHAEFDRCAREWVLAHWRFHPARRGGVAVPSIVRTQVAFVLQ